MNKIIKISSEFIQETIRVLHRAAWRKWSAVCRSFYLLMLLAMPMTAIAHSNFEDCILETMKNVKSDAAANLIAKACRNKYPAASQPLPNAPRSGSAWLGNRSEFTNKVEILSWGNEHADTKKHNYNFEMGPLRAYIKATNKNDFSVSRIKIGIPRTGTNSCPSNLDEYNLIYTCAPWGYEGYIEHSVGANESGIFECPDEVKTGFCIIDLLTDWHYDLDAFLRSKGLPPTDWK